MNWKKLNKKALKTMRNGEYFLVSGDHPECPYDIVRFLDLKDLAFDKIEIKHRWDSLHHFHGFPCKYAYSYTDEDLLHIFSHFCLIEKPKVSE